MTSDAAVDQCVREELQKHHRGRAIGGRGTGSSPGGTVYIGGRAGGGGGLAAGHGNRAYGVSKSSGAPRVVIKANYVKGGKGSGGRIRESARYYMTRENEKGEKEQRSAFSEERDEMDFEGVKGHLKAAGQNHAYHYRLVLAPETDKDAEGGDLKALTRETMRTLEKQQDGNVSWVAIEHAGEHAHTEHAHVHVIASTDRTITKTELSELRFEATLAWRLEMAQQREMQRDSLEQPDFLDKESTKVQQRDWGMEL
jgi:hypothetical protein